MNDVESLKKPVAEVQEELKNRENDLSTALTSSQEFEKTSKDLLSWLTATEEELGKQKTLSAVYETVKAQQQSHKVCRILCPIIVQFCCPSSATTF